MNEGRLWNISYHMRRQESVHKICEMKCKRNSEVQDISHMKQEGLNFAQLLAL